jgi:hypothetical protein
MNKNKAVLSVVLVMCLIGMVAANMPADWQINKSVAKILVSGNYPPIYVVIWKDDTVGRMQAEIGVPSNSLIGQQQINGLLSGVLPQMITNIPTFTADEYGNFWFGNYTAGAQEVYPATPNLNGYNGKSPA